MLRAHARRMNGKGRFARGLGAGLAWLAAAAGAQAGDSYAPRAEPLTVDQAHCQALGPGYFAVKGASACLRISGYVAAGAGFVEPGRVAEPASGPFAAHAHGFSGAATGVAADAEFETGLGPARIYVGVDRLQGQP